MSSCLHLWEPLSSGLLTVSFACCISMQTNAGARFKDYKTSLQPVAVHPLKEGKSRHWHEKWDVSVPHPEMLFSPLLCIRDAASGS